MSNLRVTQRESSTSRNGAVLSPVQSAVPGADDAPVRSERPMRLVLVGYSYGSMIASHLPCLDVVRGIIQAAHVGSAETEICLRALHLAQLHTKGLKNSQQHESQSRGRDSLRANDALQASHAVSVGGYESESTSRRISRDSSRRSIDVGVRKSLDRVREKLGARKPSSTENFVDDEGSVGADLIAPEVCYLLISPLLPPVAGFTTMFSSLSFTPRRQSRLISAQQGKAAQELVSHPSCAVYGDKDAFTSQRRLRKWAEHLKQQSESRFCFYEVNGAGHFWHEKDISDRLRGSVREWLGSLDGQ